MARFATPYSGIQFRSQAYGDEGLRSLLRDVLANTSVEGQLKLQFG